MHMMNGLISPGVGICMAAISLGMVKISLDKIKKMDNNIFPLMGAIGAFVFAAQMINFSIPSTGSSGHICGGILLTCLLGPYAAFLTLASILTIQALFFADGGLLAWGCNVFNMGIIPCFVVYPFLRKYFNNRKLITNKIFVGLVIGSIFALQLGAFSVVVESFLSGKTELQFSKFLFLMQSIHFFIGIGEGLLSAVIVKWLYELNPEVINNSFEKITKLSKVCIVIMTFTLFTAGLLSIFASQEPDGLEWSLINVIGKADISSDSNIYQFVNELQEKVAILPDYQLKDHMGNKNYVISSISGVFGSVMVMLSLWLIEKILFINKTVIKI